MALQLTDVSATNPLKPAVPAAQKDLGNKDMFLKLLVAQMKNQNPNKPQDPTQMSSQLAQFNMVEQQINTNKYLQTLAAANGNMAQGASGLQGASASYLGHSVTVNQSTVGFSGSPIQFSTDLGVDAASTKVLVRDSTGNVIRTMDVGAMAQGTQSFTWDGLSDTGATMANGDYSFEIQAVDYQGGNIQANVQRSGLVNAVRMGGNGVELMVAGSPVAAAQVSEVRI